MSCSYNTSKSRVELLNEQECETCRETVREILHIRHHSLFTPRDFDVSPYFEIIKPTIARGFDHKQLNWNDKAANSPVQVGD